MYVTVLTRLRLPHCAKPPAPPVIAVGYDCVITFGYFQYKTRDAMSAKKFTLKFKQIAWYAEN